MDCVLSVRIYALGIVPECARMPFSYPLSGMSKEKVQQIVKGSYRAEIDGFRAFAVIVVIINHFNQDILPGGYLGVDIFFVIL